MHLTFLRKQLLFYTFFSFIFMMSYSVSAQKKNSKTQLIKDAKTAIKIIRKDYPDLNKFLDKSYGYAIFPKVTEGGLGIAGANGKGVVYKNHILAGYSTLNQASLGLQAGGHKYSEIIFFKNKKSYDQFTDGKLKFDASASVVALEKGMSTDFVFKNGMAVFTKPIGGLMFKASIGGQHFSFKHK